MEESAEKKILGMDTAMVAVLGLFLTFLSVATVLAIFAFNTIRADNARIEASIAASRAELRAEQKSDVDRLEAGIEGLRAEQKADSAALRAERKADVDKLEASIAGLRVEWRADINMLSDKIDARIDSLDARIDSLDARIDSLDAKIGALDDNLDTRLDEIEREQARTQGAIDVLRSRQAPNP